uniref:Uncharacterized protein n=1 Tax=Solanum lycopersicum TaxID=4081 RepID=A0A3Q7FHH1_SOLLC
DHPSPEARCILGWPLCLTQVALSSPKLKLQQILQLFYALQLPPLAMLEKFSTPLFRIKWSCTN